MVGLLFLVIAQNDLSSDFPQAANYAPNFWFDSEEKYFPCNPLDFYYDKNLNELSGADAQAKYGGLSLDKKLSNFRVFYEISDQGKEIVYQYWLFYVFNDGAINEHYGDWESVFIFVDRNTKKITKAIGSFHQGGVLNNEIPSEKLKNIEHIWDYIGKGSHANCPDYEPDGECNFLLWRKFEDWSRADQLYGLKVVHNSSYYKFLPLEQIKSEFGKKYSQTRPLISEEKSQNLGSLVVNLAGKKVYVLPSGGAPPENAWAKEEYENPEKVSPSSQREYAMQKVQDILIEKPKSFVQNAIGETKNLLSKTGLFGAALGPA